jgi:two-component system response regulator HydG
MIISLDNDPSGDFSSLTSLLDFLPDLGKILLSKQRMVILRADALGELRRGIIDALGHRQGREVLTQLGVAAGTRDARIVRQFHPGAELIDLFKLGPRLHNLTGMVNVKPLRMRMDATGGDFEGEFIWENSIEAELHREAFGVCREAACWLQVGYASGYTSELLGRAVAYKEIACAAKGDRHCHIIGRPLAEWNDDDIGVSIDTDLGDARTSYRVSRRARLTVSKGGLIGRSASFKAACQLAEEVANGDASVMLLGETGVGKDVFANRIHYLSPRANQPFVTVNCAAIPENLIESELFGVEKGAYTGATRSRVGRLELAHGGTLFLDEIAELSAGAQAKLLRAIQEGEFHRVGDYETRHFDARLIVATNCDVTAAIKSKQFRNDLFYRVSTFPIVIPSLKERREDIPLLIEHFIALFAAHHGKHIAGIAVAAVNVLQECDWPGNIRELQNVIERCVILTRPGESIDLQTANSSLSAATKIGAPSPAVALHELVGNALKNAVTLNDLERHMMTMALGQCGGNLTSTARLLGITRPQLAYRLSNRKDNDV